MGCLIMTAAGSISGKAGWIRTYVNYTDGKIADGLKNFFHFGVVNFQNEMGVFDFGQMCL